MGTCEACGNFYDKTFEVIKDGRHYVFDSFECAISQLAPHCEQCDLRIIGHGVEEQGKIYCCAHCAAKDGAVAVRDRGEHRPGSRH